MSVHEKCAFKHLGLRKFLLQFQVNTIEALGPTLFYRYKNNNFL